MKHCDHSGADGYEEDIGKVHKMLNFHLKYMWMKKGLLYACMSLFVLGLGLF